MDFIEKSTPNLDKALFLAIDDLFKIKQDSKGNHGTYASKHEMLRVIIPALAKVGVKYKGFIKKINGELMFYIKLTHSESGEYHDSEWPIDAEPNSRNVHQSRGGATTYATRYLLEHMLGLPCNSNDDADGEKLSKLDSKPAVEEKKEYPREEGKALSAGQKKYMNDLIAAIPENFRKSAIRKMHQKLEIENENVTQDKFERVINELNSVLRKLKEAA